MVICDLKSEYFFHMESRCDIDQGLYGGVNNTPPIAMG